MFSTSRLGFPTPLFGLLLLAGAQSDAPSSESGIVTLWATDEPRSAFSFDTGKYAVDIVDGQAVLDGAQIAFHLFEPNKLTTGFVLGQAARVVDLGDVKVDGVFRASDQAFHPPLNIFHTLFLDGRGIYYRGPLSRTYRLKKAEDVFFSLAAIASSFSPEIGHCYLLRYAPKGAPESTAKLVKLRVVDYEPGRQVTIRWARMH